MPDISEKDVEKLAKLARIEMSKDEIPSMVKSVNEMVARMSKMLNSNIGEENDHAPSHFMQGALHMRNDNEENGYPVEILTKGAPLASNGYFVVPEIIDNKH